MPSMSTGVFSSGAGASGSRTCSHAPALSRSDLPACTPSSSTPPSSAIAAAALRDTPSRRATPASTRMPASPSGTGIDRWAISSSTPSAGSSAASSSLPLVGSPTADGVEVVAEDRQHHQQDCPTDHRRVRDVEHRPPADRQKVHDVAAQRSGCPEEAIDQVAHRAAEDHPQADRPPGRHQPSAHPEDPDHHGARDQRQQPGVAGSHRERGTRIADQRPGHRVADDRHRLARGQQLDGEHFGDHVQGQHHRRDRQQQRRRRRGGLEAAVSAAGSASVTGSADPVGSSGTSHHPLGTGQPWRAARRAR